MRVVFCYVVVEGLFIIILLLGTGLPKGAKATLAKLLLRESVLFSIYLNKLE